MVPIVMRNGIVCNVPRPGYLEAKEVFTIGGMYGAT